MTAEDNKYNNPSILEAVFELRFPSTQPWEMRYFVEFSNLAKDNGFPILKDSPQQVQVTFKNNQEPIINRGASHIQTWNVENTKLWQAGQLLFAANQREPYSGWEDFRPHIIKGLRIYYDIVKIQKAESLSLRYINRIEFADDELPDKLLNFLPSGIDYKKNPSNYVCRVEYDYENGEKIIIISAKEDSNVKKNSIILELLYLKPNPELNIKEIESTIDRIHENIRHHFEDLITDELRSRMEIK